MSRLEQRSAQSGYYSDMILEMRAVGPFFKNGYLVGCDRTRQAVLIDPGDEVDQLLASAGAAALDVKHILLTHGHVDHVAGVAAARRAYDAPIHLHPADLPLYEAAVDQARFFGLEIEPPLPVDQYYEDGERLSFGDFDVRVLHTPGHTQGGVCLHVTSRGAVSGPLFVGDTLFAGSIGRTDLPGGDHATLLASIRNVLLAFPDDTEVHSGHGPGTTIGHERRTNPFLAR
jgi:hydroxyacylglutathione hydrolase